MEAVIPSLVVRADSTTQMGTGHIMRCIALAQAWQDNGCDVTFLSQCETPQLRQRIIDEGFDFVPIEKPYPDHSDLGKTLDQLSAFSFQLSAHVWLVVDGYHFTPNYQRQIKEAGHRLLVIDDMAHLDHYYTDVVLNQNIHAETLQYSCEPYTRLLLGTRYVLLRREFLKWKGWKREIPSVARKVLVTLGGGDPDNVTLKVVRALNSLNDPGLEVKIVAGPANLNINSLEKELHLSPFTFHLLSSVSNMPELMAWADLAVSAGGSTCWELAFMGLPGLIVVLAENQEGIAKELEEAKVALNCGWFHMLSAKQLSNCFEEMVAGRSARASYSAKGRQLVDGLGAERVIKCMVRK